MRFGILGGTFDPIHNAHLFIAESARVALNLDRVVFIPTGTPPHKLSHRLAPAEDRFQMVSLAIDNNPAFGASRIEIDRKGPSYTLDTLTELRREFPKAEMFFLIGLDALAEIQSWRSPQ